MRKKNYDTTIIRVLLMSVIFLLMAMVFMSWLLMGWLSKADVVIVDIACAVVIYLCMWGCDLCSKLDRERRCNKDV